MPTIKENLQELHRIITAYPESKLDLQNYVSHTDCGTLFCAVGLAATMPFFMDQIGMPPADPAESGFNNLADDLSDMSEIWGHDSFDRLFASHGQGRYDEEILDNQAPLSDKELILARIDRALRSHV